MGYLKIHCHHCGGAWSVYNHNYLDDHSRVCPHCMAEIDRQTWRNQVALAYGEMEDANMELERDYTGYREQGASLFSVEYRHRAPR